jgi:hypothetical protein
LHRRSRGTTWVEQDGAEPLPLFSFACSEAKETKSSLARRAERCAANLSRLPRLAVGRAVEGSAVLRRTFRANVFSTEQSWACGPPKAMKNASVQQPLSMNRRPLLCHPERSRGICGSADLSWKCFSTERSIVEKYAVYPCPGADHRKDLPRPHSTSAKHLAEPPDAEHYQAQREHAQDQKVGPQPGEARTLDHV